MGSLDNLSVALHTNKRSHGDSQGTGLVMEGTVHTAAAKPPVLNTQAATSRAVVAGRMAHEYLGTHRKLFSIFLTQ